MEKRRAQRRKFHYIYKITRFDGKYYIGMHSTDKLEDGYFGSGKRLWHSINKYGKDKHTKEILEFLPDRISLAAKEKELVHFDLLKDKMCLNLKEGGEGGGGLPKKFIDDPIAAYQFYRAGYDAMMKIKDSSKAAKKAWQTNVKNNGSKALENLAKGQHLGTIAAAKPEAIENKKKTFAKINHMQGQKNSNFGKCWVNKNGIAISIKKDLLENFLNNGYKLGRSDKKIITKIKKIDEKFESYKLLKLLCRNGECKNELSFLQVKKKITSCSKVCANKTRVLKIKETDI